jgi:hypothetical protein
MSIRSVTSARTARTQRSAKAFAFGLRGGIFTTSIPAPDSTASNPARPANSRRRPMSDRTMVPDEAGDLPDLERRREDLYRELSQVGDFRRGSLNEVRRKCGKPNCACAQPGHPGHGPQ